MEITEVRAALDFKRDLERDFEAAAMLDGRAFYSATYSLPQQCPVMWFNLNPGGTPEDHQVLSDEQMAKGQHEFWNGHGKTSKSTGFFIQQIYQKPVEHLRSIQGTNVAWERSRKGRDIDLRAAAIRAAPFLTRYILYVDPSMLIFGGAAAFDLFLTVHKASVVETTDTLWGNWGTRQARIFMATTLDVPKLGNIRAITVSHPSRGVRVGVLERCRSHLADLKLPKALV